MKTNGGHCGQKENRGFFLPDTMYFQIGKYSQKGFCFQIGNRTEGFRFKQTEGDVKWKEVVEHCRSGVGRSNVRTAARSGTASF